MPRLVGVAAGCSAIDSRIPAQLIWRLGEGHGIGQHQELGARIVVIDAGIRDVMEGDGEARPIVESPGYLATGSELKFAAEILAVALVIADEGGIGLQHHTPAEKEINSETRVAINRLVGSAG